MIREFKLPAMIASWLVAVNSAVGPLAIVVGAVARNQLLLGYGTALTAGNCFAVHCVVRFARKQREIDIEFQKACKEFEAAAVKYDSNKIESKKRRILGNDHIGL